MIPPFLLKSLSLSQQWLVTGCHRGCGQGCLGHVITRIRHREKDKGTSGAERGINWAAQVMGGGSFRNVSKVILQVTRSCVK